MRLFVDSVGDCVEAATASQYSMLLVVLVTCVSSRYRVTVNVCFVLRRGAQRQCRHHYIIDDIAVACGTSHVMTKQCCNHFGGY